MALLPWSKEGGWAEAGDARGRRGTGVGRVRPGSAGGLRRQDTLGHMP